MNPWLADRTREVRASITTIEQLGSDLGYLQLGWRPPDGGWSIAQVFEHLIIADSSYLGAMKRLSSWPEVNPGTARLLAASVPRG